MAVVIGGVVPHSPAAKKHIAAGDTLLSVNGHDIADVLDYRFYLTEPRLRLRLLTPRGERTVRLRADQSGDIGLTFDTYLMDKQRSCRNKCIFCFIDQLPPGLRESLYFKDDDSRLSFLFGNYITLTNLTEREVQRIIDMHISPVNISVHTTDPDLRCRMMNNRFAGEALRHLYRLAQAGVALNCQLVLCSGWNDGEQLTRSMADLAALPSVRSVAAVPVGVTRYREGLTPLRPFTAEEAARVIDQMEQVGDRLLRERGERVFYPSDEFYLTAGRPMPPAAFYGEFAQLENGVGMMALMEEQFDDALAAAEPPSVPRRVVVATGVLAAPFLRGLAARAMARFPALQVEVRAIINRFFGETITVAGLITGGDLMEQLRGATADAVVIPRCMLRQEGDLFLDDVSLAELQAAVPSPVLVTDGGGEDFLGILLGADAPETEGEVCVWQEP